MEAKSTFNRMTPDFVLRVLQDSHRHQCAFDPEADADVKLGFETSVAEWRSACDLIETDGLGVALNELWLIELSEAAWRSILEPPHSRTLRDVCDAVAANARRLAYQPAGALGASCAAAGAFLTIRALLVRAGAPGSAIRPSTPVAEFARLFPGVFLGPISHLAPGHLPTVAIRTPWHTLSVSVMGLGLLGGLVGYFISPWFVGGSFLVALLGSAATWGTARLRPAEVRFGGISTFRELAQAIASTPTA